MNVLKLTKDYLLERQRAVFRGLNDRSDEENVQGKIVLITGANTGLGKALALQLAKRGATIVMACRNFARGTMAVNEIKSKTNNGELVLMDLDLADLQSIRKFAGEFKERFPQLNILVNNAGFMDGSGVLQNTKDNLEMHMAVNHLGHFLLTTLLVDHLKLGAPSRVIAVASSMHQLAQLDTGDLNLERVNSLGFGNYRPYNNSKLANILYMKELGKRLEGSGVHTYAICPGMIRTGLFRHEIWYKQISYSINLIFAGLSINEGVEGILHCVLSKKCAGDTGKVYRFCKVWETATKNLNDELALKLWTSSEDAVGLRN